MTAAMGSAGGIAAVAERYLRAVVSRGELDLVDEIFHEDHHLHFAPFADAPDGPAGVRQMVESQRRAFRDLIMRIDDLLVVDDHVVVRGFVGGVNANPIRDLPVTGRSVMSPVMWWFRFDGGRIRETWLVIDRLEGALQMGMVVPAADATAPDPGWV